MLLLIPLLPLFLWWLANRIDEAPSAAAMRYANPPPRAVADADNAWLHLAGIGAAPEADPVAYGRQRVDALLARHAQSPTPPADAAEQALFVDFLPAVHPEASTHYTETLCPVGLVDCIEWARRFRDALDQLEAANAVRLQRFEALLALRDWHGLYPPSIDTPLPDVSVAHLHRNLIARDLGNALAAGDTEAQARLLTRLADSVAFWQRVPQQATDVFAIMAASMMVHHAQLLAGDLLDRLAMAPDERLAASLDRILEPFPRDIVWTRALSFEYRSFVRGMDAEFPGTLGALRRCLAGTLPDGCLEGLAIGAAFVPQATYNLHAQNTEAMQRWLEAGPQEIEAARAIYAAVVESNFHQFGGTGVMLRQMAYNFSGRIFASIAIPKSDWGLRIHDREAVRRTIAVKREALRQGIAPEDMVAFLEAQPESLRNPYTSAPFDWDPLFRDIHFESVTGAQGLHPRLAVGYPVPPRPQGVAACPDAFELDLFDRFQDEDVATLRYVSCGSDHGLDVVYDDLDRHDTFWRGEGRVHQFEVRRIGDEVGVRLRHHDFSQKLRSYEARLLLDQGVAEATLQPISDDTSEQFVVTVRSGTSSPMVSIHLTDVGARELARQIAAASGAKIHGIERLSDNSLVTYRGGFFVEDALIFVAEHGERRPRKVAPDEFVFE